MELINERKKIILDLMNDKNYVPMKIKELAIILNVKKEDRGLLEIVLNELININGVICFLLHIGVHVAPFHVGPFNDGTTSHFGAYRGVEAAGKA